MRFVFLGLFCWINIRFSPEVAEQNRRGQLQSRRWEPRSIAFSSKVRAQSLRVNTVFLI